MKLNLNYLKKIIKKHKIIYLIFKIFIDIIEYVKNRLAYFISVIFNKFINKYFLKYSEDKFLSINYYPKNFIDFILCYSMLQKYKKLNLNQLKKINYEKWSGKSGTIWHNEDKKFEKMDELFEKQADQLPNELKQILKLEKNKSYCIVDIAVGNANFFNYFTNKANVKIKKIGLDINKTTIKKNINSKLFQDIEFLEGNLQNNKNYLELLSQDYHLIFFSRKSLTNFTYYELVNLLETLETFKKNHSFILIEMSNMNMTVEKKSRIKDYHPLFFAHNYLQIFNRFNWKVYYEKKIYNNYFKNDYQINLIFKK